MTYEKWGERDDPHGLVDATAMYADWTADRKTLVSLYKASEDLGLEAKDQRDYQRRHRAWALELLLDCQQAARRGAFPIENPGIPGRVSLWRRIELAGDLLWDYRVAYEAARADNCELDEAVDGLIGDRAYFERVAKEAEADKDKLAARVAELEAFQASVDEALNMGDGTYKP